MPFNTQQHIPSYIRRHSDPALIEMLYGKEWRLPKFVTDIEAKEILYGPTPIIRSEHDFRGYQRWMSDKIVELDAVLLGAEMGLGKTGASLHAFCRLLDEGVVTKVLVVAPVRVAEETWPEEMEVWDFARGKTFAVVTGDEDQRIASLQRDVDFYFINRENIVWLDKHLPGRKFFFDGLIYDEASRLKAGKKRVKPSKRADGTRGHRNLNEFGILTKKRYKFKKAALLTGTPTPNGIIDLWGPMYIVDKGARLGSSRSDYLKRWFRYDRWTRQNDPFDHSEDQIMEASSDVFFSLKSEDYLELPPMIPVDHYVNLTPKAREIYDRFERDRVLDEFDIEAVNKGVLTNKLLQLANGSLYLDDHSATHIHDAKLDVLESIMIEAAGAPVLVAYSFQFDIPRIQKRFPYVRLFGDSPSDKRDWDAGKIPMLLTHPASAGHGLNFQYGGNIACWYGLTWSLELYLQFIKRLHRSGQKHDKVMLHRIMARNTVDENILRVLRRKDADMDRMTDKVKAILQSDMNSAVYERLDKIRMSA